MKLTFGGSVSVELIDKDDRIVQSIKDKRGDFEPASRARWAQMCAGGGVVLDIGCYSGLFAIAAAKLGCEVLAFEPLPFNCDRIRANIQSNQPMSGHIQLFSEVAVTDQDGDGQIIYNDKVKHTSGASLLRKAGKTQPVRLMTIDAMKLEGVTAVKIDVERMEPAVLRGMRETLEKDKPSMLVEALGVDEIKAVLKELPDFYHRAGMLDDRNLLLRPA